MAQSARHQDRKIKSARTGVLFSQLKLLADGRCRGSLSDYTDIEVKMLEETYLMLHRAYINKDEEVISFEWFQETARVLFSKEVTQFSKNVTQFLNQIYGKYFLMNAVFKYLSDEIDFSAMYELLLRVFPDICSKVTVSSSVKSDSLSIEYLATPPPEQEEVFTLSKDVPTVPLDFENLGFSAFPSYDSYFEHKHSFDLFSGPGLGQSKMELRVTEAVFTPQQWSLPPTSAPMSFSDEYSPIPVVTPITTEMNNVEPAPVLHPIPLETSLEAPLPGYEFKDDQMEMAYQMLFDSIGQPTAPH